MNQVYLGKLNRDDNRLIQVFRIRPVNKYVPEILDREIFRYKAVDIYKCILLANQYNLHVDRNRLDFSIRIR